MPRGYFEAKQRIINALDVLTQDIAEGEEVFLDERIIEIYFFSIIISFIEELSFIRVSSSI